MAVGSGIGGQFGFAAETTYGTPVSPTKFLPATKAELKLVKGIAQGTGLVAGQLIDSSGQRVPTTRQGTGSIDLELQSNGFGLLLQALMGTTVTPVIQGATTAYLQTHTFADSFGKFLTLQAGVPDLGGIVRPYTAQGCKVTEADFSFDVVSTTPVMSTWMYDAQNIVETTALAAASYQTGVRPFVGTDVTIKVGTFGSEAAVDGVRKVDVKIPRPLRADMFYMGNLGLKKEPRTNARSNMSGTITADFLDKTIWADRFAADTGFSMVIEAKGSLIAGTYYQTFRITLPTCYLDGDTPVLSGPDIISGAFPFSVRFDGTNLPKIEYISTDVTL
jgi:hypothetical protein